MCRVVQCSVVKDRYQRGSERILSVTPMSGLAAFEVALKVLLGLETYVSRSIPMVQRDEYIQCYQQT